MKDILIIGIPILMMIGILILFIESRKLEYKINRTLFFIDCMKNDKKIDKESAIILITSLVENDIIGKVTEYVEKTDEISNKKWYWIFI